MYKETGVKLDKERWYEHTPKFVEKSHESTSDDAVIIEATGTI